MLTKKIENVEEMDLLDFLCMLYDLSEESIETEKSKDSHEETRATKSSIRDGVAVHKKICDKLNQTYAAKNHDYGDSFGKSCGKYGLTAAMVRMEDKWNRLNSLILGEKAKVNDDSVADTLLDLANYCIMTYMEITK